MTLLSLIAYILNESFVLCIVTKSYKPDNMLPPTGKKVHLGFFCIMSTSIDPKNVCLHFLKQ